MHRGEGINGQNVSDAGLTGTPNPLTVGQHEKFSLYSETYFRMKNSSEITQIRCHETPHNGLCSYTVVVVVRVVVVYSVQL